MSAPSCAADTVVAMPDAPLPSEFSTLVEASDFAHLRVGAPVSAGSGSSNGNSAQSPATHSGATDLGGSTSTSAVLTSYSQSSSAWPVPGQPLPPLPALPLPTANTASTGDSRRDRLWEEVVILACGERGPAVHAVAQHLRQAQPGLERGQSFWISLQMLLHESPRVCETVGVLLNDGWAGTLGELLACARGLTGDTT